MSGAHLADENLTGSFCAFGYVRADGTIANQGGDWSVVRVSAGLYRVTYGTPLTALMAPILGSAEAYATRDSVTIRYDNVTVNGFDVHTTEGDNGTAANAPRDRDWSFAVPCGEPVGVTNATQVEVDQTSSATFGLTTADIHENGAVVQMTDGVLDAEWSRAANVVTYTGAAAFVEGIITINAADVGPSSYWARPKLDIFRNGSKIAVMDNLVMQAVGTYDGDFTLSGTFFDKAPGANPAYTFEWSNDETRVATLAPEAYSQIAMKAVEKVTVYAP